MTINKSANWLLDPKEWDFRFIKPEHTEVVVVYEYARSCGWVQPLWERWLNTPIRNYPVSGVAASGEQPMCVRDVIHDHFKSKDPIWSGTTSIAKQVMAICPDVLKKASLGRLVCCAPSFPAPWQDLTAQEKNAALSLSPCALPPFRDAEMPHWSSKHEFTVSIDFDADPRELHRATRMWLAMKKTELAVAQRGAGDPKKRRVNEKNSRNRGRRDAPPREALSWLGAYRFHQKDISYLDAIAEMNRRISLEDDPTGKYPKLYTENIQAPLWSRWRRNAEWKMADLFSLRNQTGQVASLPNPRWKVENADSRLDPR